MLLVSEAEAPSHEGIAPKYNQAALVYLVPYVCPGYDQAYSHGSKFNTQTSMAIIRCTTTQQQLGVQLSQQQLAAGLGMRRRLAAQPHMGKSPSLSLKNGYP